jgi:hypothetical protein
MCSKAKCARARAAVSGWRDKSNVERAGLERQRQHVVKSDDARPLWRRRGGLFLNDRSSDDDTICSDTAGATDSYDVVAPNFTKWAEPSRAVAPWKAVALNQAATAVLLRCPVAS